MHIQAHSFTIQLFQAFFNQQSEPAKIAWPLGPDEWSLVVMEAYFLQNREFTHWVIQEALEKQYLLKAQNNAELSNAVGELFSRLDFKYIVTVLRNAGPLLLPSYIENIPVMDQVEQQLAHYYAIEHMCQQMGDAGALDAVTERFELLSSGTAGATASRAGLSGRGECGPLWNGVRTAPAAPGGGPPAGAAQGDVDVFGTNEEIVSRSSLVRIGDKQEKSTVQLINKVFSDCGDRVAYQDTQFLRASAAQLAVEFLLSVFGRMADAGTIDTYLARDSLAQVTCLKIQLLDHTHIEELLAHVGAGCRRLQYLDVSQQSLQYRSACLQGACFGLLCLNLSNNKLDHTSVQRLTTFLCQQASLRELYLNHNNLGPRGAKALYDGYLRGNQRLRVLGANCCLLQYNAAYVLRGLMHSTSIRRLDLGQNYLEDWINQDNLLLDFLRTNTSIQVLSIIDPSVPQDVVRLVAAWMAGGRGGRRVRVFMSAQADPELNAALYDMNYPLQARDPLNRRRYLERQIIYGSDTCAGTVFYAVSERWLSQWRRFVSGATERPPGRIDNSAVDLATSTRLRDYRCVNRAVWEELLRIYGGGPEILVK